MEKIAMKRVCCDKSVLQLRLYWEDSSSLLPLGNSYSKVMSTQASYSLVNKTKHGVLLVIFLIPDDFFHFQKCAVLKNVEHFARSRQSIAHLEESYPHLAPQSLAQGFSSPS
eukprot:1144297-Pelagomonas_calceolata.AAC.2